MSEQVRIELVVDDKGTEIVKGFNQELEKTNTVAKEGTTTTDNASKASNKFIQVIREERQEHRMRGFAIREGAAAMGQLSNTFVGENGLTRTIQKSVGSLFDMDFALKAVGSTMGSFGAFLSSWAIPLSVAVGGIALIREAITDTVKENEKLDDSIKKLNISLGNIKEDKVGDLRKELVGVEKVFSDTSIASNWAISWRESIDKVTFGFFDLIDTYKEVANKVVLEKQLEIEKAIVDSIKKEAEEKLNTVSANMANTEALMKLKEIQLSMKDTEQGSVDIAKQKAKLHTDEIDNMKTYYQQLVNANAPMKERWDLQGRILTAEKDNTKELQLIASMTTGIGKLLPKDGMKFIDIKNLDEAKRLTTIGTLDMARYKASVDDNMRETMFNIHQELKVYEDFLVGPLKAGIDVITNEVGVTMKDAWDRSFGEAHSLLQKFVQAVLDSIVKVATERLAKGLIGGILDVFSGGLGSLFTSLFHEGGTVPKAHEGMFINAPPTQEFPILVRGGETIRTEKQEAQLQTNGGTVVTINFNSPIPHSDWIKQSVQEGMRLSGLTIDKYFVNSNKVNIAI